MAEMIHGIIKFEPAEIKNQANCLLDAWKEVHKNADTLIADVEGVLEEFELPPQFGELDENNLRGYKEMFLTIDWAIREFVEGMHMMANDYTAPEVMSTSLASNLDPEIFA